MALIKQENSFYLFDSHARDANGMPHSNGTAIVLKFETEQHLYLLSMNLHVNAFEIVAVQLILLSAKQKAKSLKNIEYLERKRSKENEYEKQIRLQKANDYKKFKLLEETDSERELRLQNKRQEHVDTFQPKKVYEFKNLRLKCTKQERYLNTPKSEEFTAIECVPPAEPRVKVTLTCSSSRKQHQQYQFVFLGFEMLTRICYVYLAIKRSERKL